MGWRGTLRSMSAASNRASRESDRADREFNRSVKKVERSAETILNKAYQLEEKLNKDVVKALDIRYSPDKGFISEPFQMRSEIISGDISLTQTGDGSSGVDFDPLFYEAEGARIEPLAVLFTQWATIVSFKVLHIEPEYRIKLNWVKKTNPLNSLVYLVDESSSEYYYPVSTNMTGEVIANLPRIGLIAFEPFRKPTENFSIHFSSIKLLKNKGDKHYCSFKFADANLKEQISGLISKPKFVEQLKEKVNEQLNEARKKIASQNPGCAAAFFIMVSSFLILLVLAVAFF